MQDIHSRAAALKRPKLLVRAARFGLRDYRRDSTLPRLLRRAAAPRSGAALMALLDLEQDMDDGRRMGAADYSVAHHVETLIAIMAEARLLRAASRPGPD